MYVTQMWISSVIEPVSSVLLWVYLSVLTFMTIDWKIVANKINPGLLRYPLTQFEIITSFCGKTGAQSKGQSLFEFCTSLTRQRLQAGSIYMSLTFVLQPYRSYYFLFSSFNIFVL